MNRALLATVAPRPPIPPIATRVDLIDALSEAAEIEHAIMCQYLYAAFSIDRGSPELAPEQGELARSITIDLLRIARQEMEHLGILTNLLIAIGAPPNFDRPSLPLQRGFYAIDLRFQLLPFGDAFLELAERLEQPCDDHDEPLPYYPSVGAIYDRIRAGFHRLASPELFLGANDPQISNADFGATPGQVWYDITLPQITDLASALAAIDLIVIQGEGATTAVLRRLRAEAGPDPRSHYATVRRLHEIWDGLSPELRARLVKPVPSNPLVQQRGDVDPTATCIILSDPRAVALARLANRAYELMLLLLARQYGRSDATTADRDFYRKYAFFPLMTIVIRPLAEILTELPAGDGQHCAVPTFELDGLIRTYPDRDAFHVQLGERFTELAAGLAEVAAMPGVAPRAEFVAKNVAYVRDRVFAYIQGAQ